MSAASASSWEPEPDITQQRPLASGQTTNTWAIWVMALLPLLGIVLTLVQDPGAEMHRAIARSLQQVHEARSGSIVVTTVPFDSSVLVSYGLSIVLLAAQVLLAVSDQRALRRLGVIRPFPWGWAFLNPVYLIGRHVVVRRRVHGSLAPLWVWIVLQAVSFVVIGAVIGTALASALASVHLPQ